MTPFWRSCERVINEDPELSEVITILYFKIKTKQIVIQQNNWTKKKKEKEKAPEMPKYSCSHTQEFYKNLKSTK